LMKRVYDFCPAEANAAGGTGATDAILAAA
jgi:hypothetical protein